MPANLKKRSPRNRKWQSKQFHEMRYSPRGKTPGMENRTRKKRSWDNRRLLVSCRLKDN